jgi:transposase InsO family protein
MNKGKNISGLCRHVKMTRQNYYSLRKSRTKNRIDKDFILFLIRNERKVQPRIGTRKLHTIIEDDLSRNNIKIGRDRLFEVLRSESMLIEKKKAFTPKTTNSKGNLKNYINLLELYEPTAPNHIWVSDITYIRTEEGFVYAALVTDLFSRKIVGAHIGDTMKAKDVLKALNMAIKTLPKNKFPIHHSDRGSQYYSKKYTKRLKRRGLSISLTGDNHCYDNAVAERVNGILKDEYNLDMTFNTKQDAYRALWNAVEIYNTRRPHMSLNYQIPGNVHMKNVA